VSVGRHWRTLLAVCVFAMAVGLAAARVGLRANAGGVALDASYAMGDFYVTAYYPVRAFLEGENPHDRIRFKARYPVWDDYGPYLPINLVLHLPFGLLRPRPAAIAYFACTTLLTLALANVALRLMRLPADPARVALLAGLVLVSRPGHWTLLLGQHSIFLALLVYLALLHARDAPVLSGIALALSAHKPTFGIPVGVLMLAAGYRRAVAVAVVLSVAVNLPIFALLAHRAGGVEPFFAHLLGGYEAWKDIPGLNPATSLRIDATALLSRFFGHSLSNASQLLLAACILGAAAAGIRRSGREEPLQDVAIGLYCLATLLVGYHMGYESVLLTAPLLGLFVRGLPAAKPWLVRLFIILFLIPALNWVTTVKVIAALRPAHLLWVLLASIDGVCVGLLFVGYFVLALRTGATKTRPVNGAVPADPVLSTPC
jgi:hypothetical protein